MVYFLKKRIMEIFNHTQKYLDISSKLKISWTWIFHKKYDFIFHI